ncbi:MAG: Large-conductance mechanosensitive channel [Candidatus Omnitrophica bacterium]|nr:Large-conductance mechanosensitive channel [Candidatus Omnitrophota bacterium]
MSKMIEEFKTFVMRGNVLDMAVGVIVGGAFGKITTSLVNDVLMPPIGLLMGRVDFAGLFVSLNGVAYPTLVDAQKAGAPTLNYGAFLNTIINFLIVAFTVFLLIKQINRLSQPPAKPAAPPAPTTKDCPQCLMVVPIKAVRCGHCTSTL